jgi:acyl-CoA thioesterase
MSATEAVDCAAAHALAERVAQAMFANDRASQAMGMSIVRVAPGMAELRMTVRADLPRRARVHARRQHVRVRLQQL